MKKNILLVLIALVVSLQASAIRPIRKLWEMTQSDGTTIKVFVMVMDVWITTQRSIMKFS